MKLLRVGILAGLAVSALVDVHGFDAPLSFGSKVVPSKPGYAAAGGKVDFLKFRAFDPKAVYFLDSDDEGDGFDLFKKKDLTISMDFVGFDYWVFRHLLDNAPPVLADIGLNVGAGFAKSAGDNSGESAGSDANIVLAANVGLFYNPAEWFKLEAGAIVGASFDGLDFSDSDDALYGALVFDIGKLKETLSKP